MNPEPAYQEALQAALLAAFPTRAELAAMVQFGLGQNLPTIAEGANLAEAVAQLCTWAEDQAGLAALVAAARQANPTNARLATVASQYDWAALDRQRWAPPRCPYPGMRPFTAADAPDFYGRAA
ncbi:MAG TPA: effector-associated domain EAD1-containing protein, partial [Chloroflexia bacterium]|nr:effector-associated domain EAD1-containing protein [Chloroflexia bacterium]